MSEVHVMPDKETALSLYEGLVTHPGIRGEGSA